MYKNLREFYKKYSFVRQEKEQANGNYENWMNTNNGGYGCRRSSYITGTNSSALVFDDVWDEKIMRYRDNRIYRRHGRRKLESGPIA